MRWKVSAPVTWPTTDQVNEAWSYFYGGEPELPLGPLSQGDEVVLLHGKHGEVGARYEFTAPLLTKARVLWDVTGAPGRRTIEGRLVQQRRAKGPIEGHLTASGLDRPESLSTRGRIGPLTWDLAASYDERAAVGSVRIPWARAAVELRVQGDDLVADVDFRATGLTGAALNLVTRFFARKHVAAGIRDAVADIARALTEIANDYPGWVLERQTNGPRAAAREAFRRYQFELRLALAEAHADQPKRWWRAQQRWLDAVTGQLPPIPRNPHAGPWCKTLEIVVLGELVAARHGERAALIDETVARHAEILGQQLEAALPEDPPPADTSAAHDEPVPYDEWLDLRWLSSPAAAFRKARREARSG